MVPRLIEVPYLQISRGFPNKNEIQVLRDNEPLFVLALMFCWCLSRRIEGTYHGALGVAYDQPYPPKTMSRLIGLPEQSLDPFYKTIESMDVHWMSHNCYGVVTFPDIYKCLAKSTSYRMTISREKKALLQDCSENVTSHSSSTSSSSFLKTSKIINSEVEGTPSKGWEMDERASDFIQVLNENPGWKIKVKDDEKWFLEKILPMIHYSGEVLERWRTWLEMQRRLKDDAKKHKYPVNWKNSLRTFLGRASNNGGAKQGKIITEGIDYNKFSRKVGGK